MNNLTFSLIIPLWNESKNIDQLVDMLLTSGLLDSGMKEVILVNNGSSDDTGALIEKYTGQYLWIQTRHLKENLNYGGGIFEGMQHCQSDIVAYIPGDLQVSADDLIKIWNTFKKNLEQKNTNNIFVKGNRTIRKDGFNTRVVSKVYTFLANLFLDIKIKDVNGLPKMFSKNLLQHLPDEKMKTFVFDVQLLFTARQKQWPIIEIPVTFHARREGISSWSGKKIATYLTTIKQMFRLRYLSLK